MISILRCTLTACLLAGVATLGGCKSLGLSDDPPRTLPDGGLAGGGLGGPNGLDPYGPGGNTLGGPNGTDPFGTGGGLGGDGSVALSTAMPDGMPAGYDASRPFAVVYFAYDQSAVDAGERSKVDQVAEYLRSHAGAAVVVEGHCDERGSEEYNRALGERRALAVQAYLESRGIPAARVRTVSFGEDKPAVAGQNEEAYARNRRAEFVLVAPEAGN